MTGLCWALFNTQKLSFLLQFRAVPRSSKQMIYTRKIGGGEDRKFHTFSSSANCRHTDAREIYSPRFAWGGRPHRRFFFVRDRS